MRKSILVALAFMLVLTVKAQDNFHPGFQFSVKGGIGCSIGETNNLGKMLSPAAALDFEYKFKPFFALRADISGWQGKGIYDNNAWTLNYAQLAADCVFDIRGFSGYKSRFFCPYFLVGAGGMDRFNNGAIKENLPDENKYWTGNKFDYVLRVGVGFDLNVSDLVAIQLEFVENATSDEFNSKAGDVFDHQMNLLLGLKFNFGQHRGNKRDVKASSLAAREAAEAAAKAKEAADAAARAKAKAEREAKEAAAAAAARAKAEADAAAQAEAAKVYVPTYDELKAQAIKKAISAASESANEVFFNIGSSNCIPDQVKKIDAIIDYLKSNPNAKVILCGFSDKNTGNPELNMKLSEERAKKITEYLVKANIDGDRISAYWYGDTVQISDKASQNRVCVMITE